MRSYLALELHSSVWGWPGEAALANVDLIPDPHWGWSSRKKSIAGPDSAGEVAYRPPLDYPILGSNSFRNTVCSYASTITE